MPFLYRTDTTEPVGEISDRMLEQLTSVLVKEDAEDQDFFVDAATLEYMEGRGVEPELLAMLRSAIGETGAEIRWGDDFGE